MTTTTAANPLRLYQRVAADIGQAIADGRHQPGQRLASERDLAEEFGVSRPTIRRAVIALEMRGLLEARQGSGVYVRAGGQPPPPPPPRDLDIGAFDQAEARRLFEGEAAALAATLITEEELAYLETLLAEMNSEEATKEQSELADRQFHITIAQATRNSAIVRVVENTWDLRYKSRLCMQMLEKARHVRKRPLNDEHRDIIESLRTRDPKAARSAMQTHLGGLIENLLLTAELEAMEQTRERLASKREEIALRAASAAK
ncbi:GntR family transcriptional regulator [Caulobacter sp. Root1455]|uniref:FadR/GntR family transcriptional regulator n=1 Tax=Caulobacter sp. Root1455 TaxID=1736465 RepID=UPI0006FE987B|nr:FadR/GntR family transcriptional regulator [Caulobacter sp. Root1455]KQY92551.1 GntR family transcriptional regulator [Caulobacter sp. Root1455]